MAIGVGRAKRTQFNWVITGAAALVSVALNLLLVPDYGMIGSAIAAVDGLHGDVPRDDLVRAAGLPDARTSGAACSPPQASAVALTLAGKLLDVPLAVAIALVAAYPLALLCSASSSRRSGSGCEQSCHVHDRDPGEEAADRVAGAEPGRVAARDVTGDLGDDLEGGAGSRAEEERSEDVVRGEAAEPRAEDRRRTGDQRQRHQP